jgi:hypothetical protein
LQDHFKLSYFSKKKATGIFCNIEYHQFKKCSELSNFLASQEKFVGATHNQTIVSTIINELLENAFKFSSNYIRSIRLSLIKLEDKLIIETINTADSLQAESFKEYIKKFQKNGAEKLFFDNIDFFSKNNPKKSKLGLAALVKDYSCKLKMQLVPNTIVSNIVVKVELPAT